MLWDSINIYPKYLAFSIIFAFCTFASLVLADQTMGRINEEAQRLLRVKIIKEKILAKKQKIVELEFDLENLQPSLRLRRQGPYALGVGGTIIIVGGAALSKMANDCVFVLTGLVFGSGLIGSAVTIVIRDDLGTFEDRERIIEKEILGLRNDISKLSKSLQGWD